MQWKQKLSRLNQRSRKGRYIRLMVIILGVFMLVFGMWKLIKYSIDLFSSRHTAEQLQYVYYSSTTDESFFQTTEPVVFEIATPTPKTVAPGEIVATALPLAPSPSLITKLETKGYPQNPKLQISSDFIALQKESKNIVGWLSIHKMLEEAVVQKDNIYYLDHDATGNKNVNGALFIDSNISLKTRPYTYIIYGHNMKSGAMFGNLRNYENSTFYHNDPFISFNTMYETGRYVIFAVGNISIKKEGQNYLDFFALSSSVISERKKALETIISASVHTCAIDVQVDDQLLILVTCVGKDDERRIVAARRIREDEDEIGLQQLIKRSRKR